LDGVVCWVVFEAAEEVGCCYAAAGLVVDVAIGGIVGMTSEWFI
jgi:hypothetical protein